MKTVAFFAFVFCLLFVPHIVSAQLTPDDVGLQYAAEIGLTTTDIRTVVGRVINIFLGLLGIVLVGIFIYAGFLYMTAGGDASQVDTAKRWMINAVIGLVILLSAYAITAFLFRAITGATLWGGTTGGASAPSSLSSLRSGNSHLLGNGIIEYHYPERGQTDVPRNTNIAITFKRPFVLSTIIAGYNDNETYGFDDDVYTDTAGVAHEINAFADIIGLMEAGVVFALNTDNIKIMPNEALVAAGAGSADERFDTRYPDEGLIDPAPSVTAARITMVSDTFDSQEKQTLVIQPDNYLGSAATDMTYRVALRGGENGILVWAPEEGAEVGDAPVRQVAFDSMNQDGGYYWPFTTGTTLDLTPPQIVSIFPQAVENPATPRFILARNVLLQAYFSEAMDATTTSGSIGGGFNNIEVVGRCLPDMDCPCWVPEDMGLCADFQPIPGTVNIGPRYRTIEFIPDMPCETVRTNSCGDPVYCLPKNIELTVRAKAATLSDDPPKAAAPNGPLDMVGNSLDGNNNGTAEGPGATDYIRNTAEGSGDTTKWRYQVGSNIDLIEPVILETNPPSEGIGGVAVGDVHPDGPSMVPVNLPVTVLWSKMMSIGSVRSGAYNEERPPGETAVFVDPRTTVALRSYELEKANREQDCLLLEPDETCDTLPPLPPPYFFVGFGDGPVPLGDSQVTEMVISHRDFLTPNDLGFTELEIAAGFDQGIPYYQPVLGSKLQDAWQNCFYPSERSGCGMGDNLSCCNAEGRNPYSCEMGP